MKKRKKKAFKRFLCFTAGAYLVLLSGSSSIPFLTNLSYSASNEALVSDGILILKSESDKLKEAFPTNTDLNGMISAELIESTKETNEESNLIETESHQEEPVIEDASTPQIQAPDNAPSQSITVFNNKQNSIATMPLEEYVLSVLLAEMPSSYHIEALKAQAIACRTYAIYKLQNGSHSNGADICTSASHCQAFFDVSGLDKSSDKYLRAKQAVDATASQVMLYDGKPILAVYHSSSGDMTSSSREVWGGHREYLQSVPTYENTIPTFSVVKPYAFAKDDFISRLSSLDSAASSLSYDEIASSFSQSLTDSGRCHTILVGDIKIPVQSFVNKFSLRSSKFDVSFGSDSVTITTHGYGHGVGLSQMGAEQLAREGLSCYDILSHYYRGVLFSAYS